MPEKYDAKPKADSTKQKIRIILLTYLFSIKYASANTRQVNEKIWNNDANKTNRTKTNKLIILAFEVIR